MTHRWYREVVPPRRGKTWTFLRRKAGHAGAVGFLDAVEASPRLSVTDVDPAAIAAA
jgi:hypothetical protein